MDEDRDCSCASDQQGDSRMPHLECICGDRGCPRSISAALDELALGCRPWLVPFTSEQYPGTGVVERRDGCGVVELSMAAPSEARSYVFDRQTGALVGSRLWMDACPIACGGCARVAGRAQREPLCPDAHVCRVCGPAGASSAPDCEPALACGVDVTTARDWLRPEVPDAGSD